MLALQSKKIPYLLFLTRAHISFSDGASLLSLSLLACWADWGVSAHPNKQEHSSSVVNISAGEDEPPPYSSY